MDKGNLGPPAIDRVRLDGRVAVVTGASQGIGFACARRLAANGCSVVLVGRTAHTLHEAERLLSSEGITLRVSPAMYASSIPSLR